jgi:N-glycosylase/DNA lyase
VNIEIHDDFDLKRIADSGQCFRWSRCGDGWRILSGADCLYIAPLGASRYAVDCDAAAFDARWRDYFDLGENYTAIRSRIDPAADPYLWAAAESEQGIRILRQDPWETLVSFIISQNRNIPAIRRGIELLAAACGDERTDSAGQPYFAFPAPEAVAALDDDALRGCALGYRVPYVRAAARAVLDGVMDFAALCAADAAAAMAALTGLYGVGVKVASCVSLFGLHHLDAFPQDVWIKRILAREYPAGWPFGAYAPFNGVYQQYMFAYERSRAGKGE